MNDNTDVGFVPMECVKDGYSGEHSFYTKKWKDIKKGYTHFQNGDIGIAKISPCFENKKSTIFHSLPNDYGAGTTELTILRPLIVHTRFYLYVFKSAWYISEGSKNFKGNVGQQRVSKDIFTSLFIPLPPLAEQRRIVAEVERWFALIDDLEANKQDLQSAIKQVRAKVLDLAIHGKLVSQDPNDEPAIDLLRRINPHFAPSDTSHYQNIPQGWEVCRLEDAFEIVMGSSPNGSSLNMQKQGVEFHQGKICFTDMYLQQSNTYTDAPTKFAEPNSVLLCVRAPVGVVNLTDRKVCIGRGLCALKPRQGIDLLFGFYALQTHKEHFDEQATGTTFKAIGGNTIRRETFLLPPYNEQIRIRERIETILQQLDTISAEL